MKRTCFQLFMLLLVGWSISATAQDLVTDRPDFTESALTVPLRSLQIETGVEYLKEPGMKIFSYPNTLFRYGLFSTFELRFGVPGWSRVEAACTNTLFNDVEIGFKYALPATRCPVQTAILFHVTLPTGDECVRSEKSDFSLIYSGSIDLSENIGLGWNAGASSVYEGRAVPSVQRQCSFFVMQDGTVGENERSWVFNYSIAAGFGLSEKWGCFAETVGEFADGSWAPMLDGGFTYLVTPLFQLDGYLGIGLNEHAPDLVVGGGFSVRLDKR